MSTMDVGSSRLLEIESYKGDRQLAFDRANQAMLVANQDQVSRFFQAQQQAAIEASAGMGLGAVGNLVSAAGSPQAGQIIGAIGQLAMVGSMITGLCGGGGGILAAACCCI